MPHTKSAWKRMKQAELRQKRNRSVLKSLKLKTREANTVLKTGDAAKAGEELKTTQKKLDQAAAGGYIHKNKAARLKSRFVKKLRALAAPAK
jgi:small subunit ribosomal protein S20